jgi:hypothetical protein
MDNRTFLGQPTLFWVEIGRKVPKYARRNMVLHSELHPELKQFLVTHEAIYSLSKGRSNLISKIERTSELERFQSIQKNIASPQRDFWVNTTSRFFYLQAATYQLGIEEYVHIESDVILLNLDSITHRFRNHKSSKIGYPLETPELGCASIFIVRDQTVFTEFLDFALDSWQDSDSTDMTLLAGFANSRPDCVEILPTWVENRSLSGSVFFDAGTIGKFYLGCDARNLSMPFSRRGMTQNSYDLVGDLNLIDLGRWCVNSDDGEAGNLKGLSVTLDSFKLANIHVHSKQIPKGSRVLKRRLKMGFNSKKNRIWKIGRIDGTVFLERFAGAMLRRLGINVKKHISFR